MPRKKKTTKEPELTEEERFGKAPETAKGNPSNPNGANQYLLDPRQKLCWDLYVNPKSETFGNATQSAIKAGYEPDYADQITTSEWFKGKLRRMNLLSKAEKVLEEMLDMPITVVDKFNRSKDDEDYDDEDEQELVVRTEPALIKIKQDTAKFVASTQGKDEGYSTRSEVTGKGGDPLFRPTGEEQKKVDDALDNYLYKDGV
jgi:hypothetical protein